MKIGLLSLMIAVGLAGCAVALPEPAAHDLAPKAQNWQASQPADARLAALENWWKGWNDPVLDQLLTAAQDHNPTLELAEARIREARAKTDSAKSYLWPSINGNGNWTRSNNPLQPPIGNLSQGRFDASWEIDLWGGVRAAAQGLLADLSAKTDQWHDARASLAAEVANLLVTQRAYRIMQAIVKDDAASRNQSLALTRDKQEAGLASPVDVALLDASYADAQNQLAQMHEGMEVSIKSLVALTGLDEPQVRKLLEGENPQLTPPPGFVVDSLPANVLQQRPDIRIAADGVKSAAADVGVAKVQRLPSISLTGSIGRDHFDAGSTKFSATSWSFGPSISIPIFNGGRLKADQEAAEARYDQALAGYKQQVRQAVSEVEQNMVRLDSSHQRVAALKRSVAGYQTQLSASEALWQAGSASILDLEVSRRFLLTAQTQLVTVEREEIANWIALYKSIGGGWPVADGQQTAANP